MRLDEALGGQCGTHHDHGGLLEAGGLRAKMRWAETPDLVDLQLYDEPMPEAFDVLNAAIASALSQLGSTNIRVTA